MIRTCVIADRSVGFQSAEVTGEITEDSANSVCQTFSDLDGVPPITKNDLEAAHRTRLSIFGRCGNITEELGGNQNDDAPLSSSSRCSQHSGEAAANNKACAAGSRRSMARLEVRHNSGLLLGLVIVFLSQVSVVTAMNGTVRITITAIFEEKDVEDLEVVFYRTIQEFNNGSDDLTWFGQAVTAGQDVKETLSALCNLMEGRRSSLHVLVVFGNMSTIQTVSLLSQTLGIPMMGYMMDKGDGHIQVHNPFYLSLQPANTHMARGLVSLLAVNYWYRVTILVESELRNDGFRNAFHKMTHEDSKWDIQNELFLSRALTDRQIEAQLSTLGPNVSRIFILHSSTSFAQRVFLLAPRVLNNERQYAWIVTGNAYTRDDKILKDFPLGTKAFLMNHDLHVNELFRDTLDFILTVFQENPRLHRTKPRMLQRGCWTLNGEVPIPFHNDVYKCLIKTVIHGLTGELKFDVDGYLNISTFRVRNLVHDGHEHVWQDVGCVQGREVHPFGIIWPGEVRRLKSGTEGRKRYRVVTNPVQPFVMTEAPHPDYGECLTDTPCLNLTSKRKSQEEVLKAITAYENGMENQSDLYRIQCCRGLTIDMLNRLASDLDFDFTLYIVQDETYGQKKQGQWNGMMKDLIDGTAHFAVAAFSITRVRQRAIDFTDPYFFSGFSVLYSDRTRETSMLAFLEPFDIIVWFAIIVSANFAAVTMALFEWNSPFGLNPWGRKRKQNYSLASGLTMVFSVLFGHTVKTKSPKAWPSKVMQNCWASAAIFIIASYTANLAAFIAGKHAGINYNDIKDNRLLFIKVGSLQGSAVEEFLRRMQSKLLAVSSRYPVPKTDVGIDWVIKGKYDALLGDYPILDYARAHLAPSCELKLVSKIFGDDQYGLGLPKGSPLKAVLSKKILEYHQTGYVDDLKDVHFADAHCIKKRISEEDSKLEVGHLAGLFVMLCVGFGVGVLTLFLEYIVFWWLVPFLRQAPTDSVWRSIHGMFLSQRLHRTVNSAELVSPHESLREIVAIVRTRDFTRLFMKSTIRTDRLAGMAKAKRLNRNFCDMVEKANWQQEKKIGGLASDSSFVSIMEIPLKDLGSAGDRDPTRSQDYSAQTSTDSSPHARRKQEGQEKKERHSRCMLVVGKGQSYQPNGRSGSRGGVDACQGSSTQSPTHDSFTTSIVSPTFLTLHPPLLSSSSSTLGSSVYHGALAKKRGESGGSPPSPSRPLSHFSLPTYATPIEERMSEPLPNGSLVRSRSYSERSHLRCDLDCQSHRKAADSLASHQRENRGELKNMCSIFSDNHGDLAVFLSRKVWEAKDNHATRVLLQKTRSYQDHLCFTDTWQQGLLEAERMTKEELLVLWRNSELELNRKLFEALKEKTRLEKKLAVMKDQPPT